MLVFLMGFKLTLFKQVSIIEKLNKIMSCKLLRKNDHYFRFQHQLSTNSYQSFVSENQNKLVSLKWFQNLQSLFYQDSETQKNGQQIPFTIFVMNEFMDALPVMILQYTSQGWKQKSIQRSKNSELSLQLGISQNPIPEKFIPQTSEEPELNEQIQFSPQSLLTMDLMAKIVNKYGGAIINVDYGEDGSFSDSIRGIKDHHYVPSPYFWEIPGECDISAYVNFKALAQFAQKNQGIKAYEILPQGYFLEAMGIVHRVDILKQNGTEEDKKRLDSEEERLVDPSQMGEIYKVQIITKKQYGDIYPFIQIDEHSF